MRWPKLAVCKTALSSDRLCRALRFRRFKGLCELRKLSSKTLMAQFRYHVLLITQVLITEVSKWQVVIGLLLDFLPRVFQTV